MQVKILTFVTNFDGVGPGHSAVAVDQKVYTFEDVWNGWLQKGSAWKTLDYYRYYAENPHRPILAQTIPQADGSLVEKYVKNSSLNDDDYIGSGVCSQQVARAINYALPPDINFDPTGFDTPLQVYNHARTLGLSINEDYTWAGRSSLIYRVWQNIFLKLSNDYPIAKKSMEKTSKLYQ